MQLIGMLDSPYVRRVAISLHLLGIEYQHLSLSVFRNMPEFRQINPVIKVPTLVCDDGEVLMDSSLILDYLERLVPAERRLLPEALPARQHALRGVGLALAAMEKAVQAFYECQLRPAEARHAPWLARVEEQLNAACGQMEDYLQRHAPQPAALDQASLSMAVAWRFIAERVPEPVPDGAYPLLRAWSRQAETHPAFLACPFE
ncbi:glutathione S-transferase family protein [Vogesella oryzae]|uniref:glutathione S-transferase family protein n=1 Tax=Vogesella oryzae TaxID=1735285 RepID=UPI00158442AD|nr:glutathione S-transferase [Vogesella oryzae]